MYGLIDIPLFEVIANTCSSTDIPPNPIKKLQIITDTEIALEAAKLIQETPFVSSTNPAIIPPA